MQSLAELIPMAKIEARLGRSVEVERLVATHWEPLVQREPENVVGICLHSWHRLVQSGFKRVDPQMIGPYIDPDNPRPLVEVIERVVRQPLVRELGFLEAVAEFKGKSQVVATSCAALIYSGELHLYDILMADRRRSIPVKRRKSVSQRYQGFGALGEVMQNLRTAAKERGCSVVTLTAAYAPLVPIFERYGFRVEDNAVAEGALRLGHGVPMEVRI